MSTVSTIVIVGGAVVGSAVAYFLSCMRRAGEPAHAIIVVERDPGYGACSTARSAGGLRQQFSTAENIQLSRASLEIIRALGWEQEVAFRERGSTGSSMPARAARRPANGPAALTR